MSVFLGTTNNKKYIVSQLICHFFARVRSRGQTAFSLIMRYRRQISGAVSVELGKLLILSHFDLSSSLLPHDDCVRETNHFS